MMNKYSCSLQYALLGWAATLLLTFSVHASGSSVQVTHGPILGRLSADGVGIWVRTSNSATFQVRYGLSPDNMETLSKTAMTGIDQDNTGWLHLKGLRSNTTYYYQVLLPENPDHEYPGGSFRTLPRPDDYKDAEYNPDGLFNFRFEFACGNKPNPHQPDGPLRPTFVTMLEQLSGQIDFAILNGDWLYENKRDYPVAQWREQVRIPKSATPEIVQIAPSVVGVWENYKDYLENDPNLAQWHRVVPSFFTFDDHEILGDVNGAGEIGYREKRAVFRDIGVKAWKDYLGWSNPPSFTQEAVFGTAQLEAGSDILTDPDARFDKVNLEEIANLHMHWGGALAGTRSYLNDPGDPNAGVYEIVEVVDAQHLRIYPSPKLTKTSSYSLGRLSHTQMRVSNCHFLFLDTRSFRQVHDINHPDKPGVSILGTKQKEWLKRQMRQSDAEFFFVVSSVNVMIPHVAPGSKTSNKDEAWTAYREEREELIDFWDGLGKPVFVLTGDLHNSFAIKITDRVWEFASGPHSSDNHSANSEGGRPPNGPFLHGPRACDIRWSSYVLPEARSGKMPHYCVVQVNNVFRNAMPKNKEHWIAYPKPHVLFQYYDGLTGALQYAEPIFAESE